MEALTGLGQVRPPRVWGNSTLKTTQSVGRRCAERPGKKGKKKWIQDMELRFGNGCEPQNWDVGGSFKTRLCSVDTLSAAKIWSPPLPEARISLVEKAGQNQEEEKKRDTTVISPSQVT